MLSFQISLNTYTWPSGVSSKNVRQMALQMSVSPLTATSSLYDESMLARETLIGHVCDVDAQFAEGVLNADGDEHVGSDVITDAIRSVD